MPLLNLDEFSLICELIDDLLIFTIWPDEFCLTSSDSGCELGEAEPERDSPLVLEDDTYLLLFETGYIEIAKELRSLVGTNLTLC